MTHERPSQSEGSVYTINQNNNYWQIASTELVETSYNDWGFIIKFLYNGDVSMNRLFLIPFNHFLTVLDFVCFVMHFYQLLHTFTVNKHKSG